MLTHGYTNTVTNMCMLYAILQTCACSLSSLYSKEANGGMDRNEDEEGDEQEEYYDDGIFTYHISIM